MYPAVHIEQSEVICYYPSIIYLGLEPQCHIYNKYFTCLLPCLCLSDCPCIHALFSAGGSVGLDRHECISNIPENTKTQNTYDIYIYTGYICRERGGESQEVQIRKDLCRSVHIGSGLCRSAQILATYMYTYMYMR